jgi:DNA-binding transcriptional MocR family regulator
MTSTFMTHLLQTGQLQAHITQTLQPAYAARYHTLLNAITTHLLPLGFNLPRADRDVAGGFFLWLGLPEGLAASHFARVCVEREEGVVVAPGLMFEVPGDSSVRFRGNVRLCFAWESEGNLEEGVRRMRDVAERLLLADGGGRKVEGEYVFVEKRDVRGAEEFK